VAKRGAIVLVGRGANVILGREATLRVRLVAPPEHRANRLSRLESITTAEALKRIQKVDAERRRFLKHFFHVDPDDARINDLTIDTSRIPPERCAEILLAALRARGVEVNAHAKA
jgi:cytidylate kinase